MDIFVLLRSLVEYLERIFLEAGDRVPGVQKIYGKWFLELSPV